MKPTPGKAYFDLDGDKELRPSPSEEEVPLTWRGDPDDTYADWNIVVVTQELETTTYHVHKSVLCFGSRHSKFFAKIMLNKQKSHSHGIPSTKVELDQRDADNFPTVLDFMYAPAASFHSGGTVITAASTLTTPSLLAAPTEDTADHGSVHPLEDISTSNAVSLRFLARRFEIDALTMAVNKFIQKDLCFKTGPAYLVQAYDYKDNRLLESAQRLCAENFQQIDKRALCKLPLDLFRIVVRSLESYEEDNNDLSDFVSEVVCRYLEKHPKHLCATLLIEWTDPLIMPSIASEAAIGFTALIKELDAQDAMTHWNELLSLSRRCAKAVVREYGWNDFSVNAAVDEYLGHSEQKENTKVDSLLFATSFAAALEQAQDDYEELAVEQQRLEGMIELLRDSVDRLETAHEKKDVHMARQQATVEEARKQIMRLKEEIGQVRKQQLKRPPNSQGYKELLDLDLVTPLDQHSSAKRSTPPRPKKQTPPRTKSPPRGPRRVERELISPSQVTSEVQEKKKSKALRTKEEMRAHSLLV